MGRSFLLGCFNTGTGFSSLVTVSVGARVFRWRSGSVCWFVGVCGGGDKTKKNVLTLKLLTVCDSC